MKATFSTAWKGSSQARKQRKYRYNVPLHLRTSLLGSSLHKALREKYKLRTLPIRKGDKVKIVRGSLKGKEATVERVNPKKQVVFLENIRVSRRDGSEVPVGIVPSKLQIISLGSDDARRLPGKAHRTVQKIKKKD